MQRGRKLEWKVFVTSATEPNNTRIKDQGKGQLAEEIANLAAEFGVDLDKVAKRTEEIRYGTV